MGQLVLKLTSPGVPDFYQGNELWDFSLVDSDNRRPVDYAVRQESLQNIDDVSVQNLFRSWKDGRIKMRLIRSILHFRREHPKLFSQGAYLPLAIDGPNANCFISFMRRDGDEWLLVVALTRQGKEQIDGLSVISENTYLTVLETAPPLRDLFSDRETTKFAKQIPLEFLLNGLPVGVFHSIPVDPNLVSSEYHKS